ncbi:hypothetical protein C8N46_101577 [Kordia periserrulae]|uniref:Uncharacterized protein n=1 Tax=Kordia periserrulae TaxID=701523 RepID=A0A2T6C6P4_9FLAO|nr:hypothetical protein [Kordia periserrulae]PTX63967.1 hypothetical protein C8N46_101577 [Kordia periserrulae]
MSGTTKNTIQKILLVALSAMAVSIVCISFLSDRENKEKSKYLKNEKSLVEEELREIIKNYDHLTKEHVTNSTELLLEKKKAEVLLDNIAHTTLDYESLTDYRKKMIELRKSNLQIQRKLHSSMSSGSINTSFK